MIYGTLVTQPEYALTEAAAGITGAMLELSWSDLQPEPGGPLDPHHAGEARHALSVFKAAGMTVTLGLGMHYTPPWVFALPDSRYTDHAGNQGADANFVYSQAVRTAAAAYLALAANVLPLREFTAIRLTSGGNPEMLYPDGDSYWAYGSPELTGRNLATGRRPNPFPWWTPGTPGLSQDQAAFWADWYVAGLVNVTAWQIRVLDSLGFTGTYQLVTPGSGVRPSELAGFTRTGLPPDPVMVVGAAWHRYYAMIPATPRVCAYVSSMADGSGEDDCTQPRDLLLPTASPLMDSWSATRWITRLAADRGLRTAGENPGFGASPLLDARYKDTGPDGMMATALRQARASGFAAFYWAHDDRLWDGTVPFKAYAAAAASTCAG